MRTWIFCAMMMISSSAWGDFKSLTRDEPVVRMVLQEAAHERFVGMVAVAGVAFDRAADYRWPASVRGVVYEPYQFEGMSLKLRHYSQEQVRRARAAVRAAKFGVRPCGTVYWFHATWMMPDWDFNKIEPRCRIDGHRFYGDVK